MLRTCQTDIRLHREPCVHLAAFKREMFMSTCFASICPSCGSDSDPSYTTMWRRPDWWVYGKKVKAVTHSDAVQLMMMSSLNPFTAFRLNACRIVWRPENYHQITVTTRVAQNLGLENWLVVHRWTGFWIGHKPKEVELELKLDKRRKISL